MNKNVKSIELSDKTSEFKDHKTYIQANHKHLSKKRESLINHKRSFILNSKKAISMRQIYNNDCSNSNNAKGVSIKPKRRRIQSLIMYPEIDDKSKKVVNNTSNKDKDKDKEKSSALDISMFNKESSFQMNKYLANHIRVETHETKHEQFIEFFINNNARNREYKFRDNTISTTKFNFFTFLPKGLMYQFSRLSNVYFLFTAIIQSIPLISPLTSITAIVPLIFVLGVSMVRELIEDLGRRKYDNINNEEEVIVFRNNEFVRDTNKTLRHGEIILIYENQEIPADMIVIDTTFKEGTCYVETSSLDGEKTLKLKVSNKYTQGFISRKFSKIHNGLEKEIKKDKYKFEGYIKINSPNADLNYVNGTFHPKLESEDICVEKDIIISSKSFLLKGSILKNTNWIIGVVVYTGMENKIILNSKKPRLKISKIEKKLNYYLLFVFCFLMVCCSFCSIYHHFEYESNKNYYNNFVFTLNNINSNAESFIVFFTYFLLLNTFIPISLVVSTEIIKMIQGIIIMWDVMLYSKFRHTFCKVKTISIIEELGNINFIFTDKTGTLTKNQLQLKYCIIDDKIYQYEKIGERKKSSHINRRDSQKRRTLNTFEVGNKQKLNKLTESNKNIDLLINKKKHASDENIINNAIKKNRDDVQIQRQKSFFGRAKSKNLSKFSMSQKNNSCHSHQKNKKNNNIKNIYTNTITVSSFPSNHIKKRRNSNIIILDSKFIGNDIYSGENKIIKITDGYFINPKINTFIKNMQDNIEDPNTSINYINEFWTALALTNECMIKFERDEIKYMCTSPDDLELVKSAKHQGYKLIETSFDSKTIKIGDKKFKYQILKVLGFSSERKRMSIVVKNEKGIRLYIKGADSEISKRLSKKSLKSENYQVISKGLIDFSRKGLRTLMVAFRKINEEDYRSWMKQLHQEELNMKNRQKLIDRLYDIIEKNLTLLGGTAVEDKLQDNVPETIKELRSAKIKIWVLTGDKLDTAENIGRSCNLISQEQKTFVLKVLTEEDSVRKDPFQEMSLFFHEFQSYIDSLIVKYNLDAKLYMKNNSSINSHKNNIINDLNKSCKSQSEISDSISSKSSMASCVNFEAFQSLKDKNILEPFNIIIEAPILYGLFREEENTENFFKIAYFANAVICCRVSPAQKSQIVSKMKEFDSKAVTMAVGDGGNDVSMIMEANIGIGIVGEEGTSAVQASDFSIGEFQILKRLLFYHGRNNLYRISKMILYFFYKNFVFTMTQFYFSFSCLSSGQTIIDDWYITCYNLIFTALPLCIKAITDTDMNINDKKIIKNLALLYRENRDNYKIFRFKSLLINLATGIIISFLIYMTSLREKILIHGFNSNIWYISLYNYISTLIVVSMNLIITANFIVPLLPLSIMITTFLLLCIFLVMNHYGFCFVFNSKATIETSFSSIQFYISIILISGYNFIIDYTMKISDIYFNDRISSKLLLYHRRKEKDSYKKVVSRSFQNKILKDNVDNEFEKSNNYLMNNKSLSKINIINNNNKYLNFNILPGVGMNNKNEINNLSELKNLGRQISGKIINYSDFNSLNNNKDNSINEDNDKESELKEEENE